MNLHLCCSGRQVKVPAKYKHHIFTLSDKRLAPLSGHLNINPYYWCPLTEDGLYGVHAGFISIKPFHFVLLNDSNNSYRKRAVNSSLC